MTDEDKPQFMKMMTLCAEQYGRSMSPDLIGFYFDGLVNLPLQTVRAALAAHVADPGVGQFMPKIADIVRLCSGSSEEAAYVALGKINAGFSRCDDEIANRVIEEMGGFPALRQREAEEWQSFGSKDFIKRYCIYKQRERAEAAGLPAPEYAKRIGEQLKIENKISQEAFEQSLADKANP